MLRPWPAQDGLMVRLRVPGGRVSTPALRALVAVADRFGDGRVHLTSRANLQVRALPAAPADEVRPDEVLPDDVRRDGADVRRGPATTTDGPRLRSDVLAAVRATGLLPSPAHDLARNVLASPQTGLAGGRADLRPTIADLDRRILADDTLAGLPGRFLFVLDDGRGDVLGRPADLGLVALDASRAQLRVGPHWGPVVALADAPAALTALAGAFLRARGTGPGAPWHVAELTDPLHVPVEADPRVPVPAPALPFGRVAGGHHVPAGDGLDRAAVDRWCPPAGEVVVTPWRGVLVPEETR